MCMEFLQVNDRNGPNQNQGNTLNSQSTEKETPMANQHRKRCSCSLESKTHMRFHHKPNRWVKNVRMWNKNSSLLLGVQNGVEQLQNTMWQSNQVEATRAHEPATVLLGMHLERNSSMCFQGGSKNIQQHYFIAKNWR